MADTKDRIPFGMADITVGEGANAIRFDGKLNTEGSQLQAEGGSVNIEPEFEGIQIADFGTSDYDDYATGMAVSVTIVAAEENVDILKLAIPNTEDVRDGGEVTGVTDSPFGQSNREKAVKINIHPRNAGDDRSRDITIYKMATTESFERPYGLEQGQLEINYKAYPRDGADASKPGNFFYTGSVDPNAEEEEPTP